MVDETQVQYVSDDNGTITAVIVPLRLWHEIASERETAYLLKRDMMRHRLLEAMQRTDSIPLDEAHARLGV